MNLEDIAKVCHQVNKAYCEAIGDHSQKDWSSADQWQRESAIKGVLFILDKGMEVSPGDTHKSWLAEKEAAGWKWGEVKDADAKTHPCFVAFEHLPVEQQAKDHLFVATVKSLAGYLS